jgi:hypothetical protein
VNTVSWNRSKHTRTQLGTAVRGIPGHSPFSAESRIRSRNDKAKPEQISTKRFCGIFSGTGWRRDKRPAREAISGIRGGDGIFDIEYQNLSTYLAWLVPGKKRMRLTETDGLSVFAA